MSGADSNIIRITRDFGTSNCAAAYQAGRRVLSHYPNGPEDAHHAERNEPVHNDTRD